MRRSRLALLAAALGLAIPALAQDDEPDLSFLEYLGSWQEGDEEWLIVAEVAEMEEGLEDEPEHTDRDSGRHKETDETDGTDETDEK